MDTWSPAPTAPPPSGTAPTEPFSESFDIVRSVARSFAALKRCFPVLFVGGCLRACTEGGGGGGGSGGGDTSELLKSMKQHSSNVAPGAGPWAWLHEVGSGIPGFPDLGGLGGLGALGEGFLIALVVGILALLFGFFLLRVWVTPGWIRNYAEVVRTGDTSFNTLFGGADVFGPTAGWLLIAGIFDLFLVVVAVAPFVPLLWIEGDGAQLALTAGGSVLALAVLGVWAYVHLGLRFVLPAIAIDRLPMGDAIARSWALSAGNRWWLLLFTVALTVVSVVLGLAGYCLCFVGIFLSLPVSFVVRDFGLVEGYLRITRPDEIAEWSINEWGGG